MRNYASWSDRNNSLKPKPYKGSGTPEPRYPFPEPGGVGGGGERPRKARISALPSSQARPSLCRNRIANRPEGGPGGAGEAERGCKRRDTTHKPPHKSPEAAPPTKAHWPTGRTGERSGPGRNAGQYAAPDSGRGRRTRLPLGGLGGQRHRRVAVQARRAPQSPTGRERAEGAGVPLWQTLGPVVCLAEARHGCR